MAIFQVEISGFEGCQEEVCLHFLFQWIQSQTSPRWLYFLLEKILPAQELFNHYPYYMFHKSINFLLLSHANKSIDEVYKWKKAFKCRC
jgi:hypothetical protein